MFSVGNMWQMFRKRNSAWSSASSLEGGWTDAVSSIQGEKQTKKNQKGSKLIPHPSFSVRETKALNSTPALLTHDSGPTCGYSVLTPKISLGKITLRGALGHLRRNKHPLSFHHHFKHVTRHNAHITVHINAQCHTSRHNAQLPTSAAGTILRNLYFDDILINYQKIKNAISIFKTLKLVWLSPTLKTLIAGSIVAVRTPGSVTVFQLNNPNKATWFGIKKKKKRRVHQCHLLEH